MANIKFSQFTQKTTLGTVDFLVGYTGADNVQIDPADLLSDYSQGTGAAGQVTFFSATSTVTGDNDLYWDNTNKRLGIKTTTPGVSLDIFGSGLRVTTNAGALSAGYFAQLYSDYGSNALRLKSRAGDVFRATDFGQAVSILTGTTASGTSERLHINSSGNVGIGTSSPSAKLHVDGTFIATGISQLGSGGSNVYLTSSSAGNVGIGTSSPAFKTTIYSSGTTDSFPLVVGQGNAANEFVGIGLSGFIASNGAVKAAMVLNRDSTYGVGDIHFLNNTTQDNTNATLSDSRLVIKKSGNVGIGTTTPLGELHVKDVGAIYTSLSGSDSAVNFVEGGGNPWRIGNRSADDSFRFSQSSSSLGTNVRFIIANGGNVGIGTTSPDTILEVVNDVDNSSNTALDVNAGIIIHNGDSSGTAVLKLRGSGGDSGAVVFGGGGGAASDKFHVISRHNQTKRFTVQANGNVGIGTSSPQAALHVSGSFNTNAPTGNGVLMGYYNSTHGYIQLNGSSGGYIDFSTSGVDHKGRILYDNTSNYFRFDTDGTERMRITSGGNVGIGTTSPSSKLEISEDSSSILNLYRPNSSTAAASFLDFNFNTANGTKAVYARIRSDVETNTDSGQGGDLSFHTANAGTISEVMRLTENGNVGIGTSSPLANLTVTTSMSSSPTSTLYLDVEGTNTNGGGSQIVFNTSATSGNLTNYNAKITGTRVFGTGGDSELGFWTTLVSDNVAAQQRMVITKEGNVGIGTTSPQAKLEITTLRESGIRLSSSDISAAADELLSGIDFYSPDTGNEGIKASIKVNYADTAANSYMTFSTGANTERMRINSSGDLLFGTTGTPNGTSVYGSAFLNTTNERMALVQATDTTSLATMQTYYNPNGAVGSIKTTGSATQFNTSSDYRLKEDLKDFDGLDKVSKIPVYDFKWKVDDSRSYGVMAHELQEVLPDAVSGEKDAEEMQGVDYSKIVPLLIKSIQELEAKVKELESK